MSSGTEPAGFEHRRLKGSVRKALFGRSGDPTRIGRFTVLRRLGAGGMGVVYSAYDDELERKVAIKVVREERGTDDASRERLRREALAVAKLNHPNVVSVFEVGSHDDRLFVAMEFVRGGTVRQWLAKGERSWREIRDVFVWAADGVAAAHDAGLVHRDLKPDNVMVVDGGPVRVKVLDFGLASVTRDEPNAEPPSEDEIEATQLTVTGHVLGTPAYMPPEQRRGERVDARGDQYALCVSLWEALHGAHPFVVDGALDRDAAKRSRPLVPRRRGVPSWLDSVVSRGMSANSEDRYPSMHALADALRRDPARRLRQLGFAAVGVAVVAGFALYGAGAEACPPVKSRIAKTWDAERQAEVRKALVRRDPDLSLGRWGAAVARVDEHLDRWGEVYEQTCDAQGSTDDASLLERRLCLESNLEAVERSIAVVAESGELGTLLADVPSPEACSEDERARELARIASMRRRPAPAGSESGLVSNFEDGLQSRFGAGWQWSTDKLAGGKSTVDLSLADEGYGDSARSVKITGEVAAREFGPRWSGAIVFLGDSPMDPVNFSDINTVTFAARGQPGTYMFMVFTSRTTLSPDAETFEVTEEWQTHRIALDELVRDRYDVTAIFFGSGETGTFELLVDDVAIE